MFDGNALRKSRGRSPEAVGTDDQPCCSIKSRTSARCRARSVCLEATALVRFISMSKSHWTELISVERKIRNFLLIDAH
jgi:hypothetical protein